MLSKKKIQIIKQLQKQVNFRDEKMLFCAETPKVIASLLAADFELVEAFYTQDCLLDLPEKENKCFLIENQMLKKISSLVEPQQILAIFKQKKMNLAFPDQGRFLVLDRLQDPGNVGTIIRICSFFGMKHLVISEDTADVYQPKIVQASMGALGQVQIHKLNIFNFLQEKVKKFSIFLCDLEGENFQKVPISQAQLFVLGNEGKGIREEILEKFKNKITIPKKGKEDSLNVAIAAGIIAAQFA